MGDLVQVDVSFVMYHRDDIRSVEPVLRSMQLLDSRDRLVFFFLMCGMFHAVTTY